jgi:hypothetical protein
MAAVLCAGSAVLTAPIPAGASSVPGASACPTLPADNVWHSDATGLPVHPRSSAWLTSTGGAGRHLHPDFGPSYGEIPRPYGIPYEVVPSTRTTVPVSFDYADESDEVLYPFAATTPIEGGQNAGGDRHALMVDPSTCTLFELFDARYAPGGGSTAGSGAVYDLRSNALRPSGWTSADAAGLPILPGLLRLDEVQAGHVDHVVRMTASLTDRSFLWPARHQAGGTDSDNAPPMGARFRMKAGIDVSGYRPDTQVVLRAFKKHGLMLADNGSNWYFSGTSEDGWPTDLLDELKSLTAGMFEAVDASSLMLHPDSGQVRLPADPRERPAAWRAGVWQLRASTRAVSTATSMAWGAGGDIPVTGDWNGDGVRTPGFVRGTTWHLTNSAASPPVALPTFSYGQVGDVPVVGDWDGDGDDTIGVVRAGTWLLRNALSAGAPTVTPFSIGTRGRAVVGDWDGDGDDTVGLVSGGIWRLTDSLSAAPMRPSFMLGEQLDAPVVGDWDGDGGDDPGFVRSGRWHLRNSLTSGPPSYRPFELGRSGARHLSWG